MEIEVKARLTDREAVLAKLASRGCVFSAPKTQDDMVWVERIGSLETFLSNKVFLRIRIQNSEKVILTAKKPQSKSGDESLIKKEHEVVIDSAEEARGLLDLMGFQEAVRVVKTRLTSHFEAMEICIDTIENLGSFIELERMGSEQESAQIQQEMMEFLASLGIPPEERVAKGYDILMLEKAAAN